MANLKERFLLACDVWSAGRSHFDFWNNWRGDGNGADGQPCLALVQYARSVGCGQDTDLELQLQRILAADLSENLNRAAAFLPAKSGFPVEHRKQLADLVCGTAAVVSAAVAHRSQPNSETAKKLLRQAARFFFDARRLNPEDAALDIEPVFPDPTDMFNSSDPAGSLVISALGTFEDNRASQTVKLILRRLLTVLWSGKENPPPEEAPTFDNQVKTLLVGSDRTGSITGHVAPTTLERRSESFHGIYPDPTALGVTVLDSSMQHSLALAWKCVWQSLKANHDKDATAVRLIPRLPVQVPVLEGGSAGALLACGLYATALRQRLDARRTATAAIDFQSEAIRNAISYGDTAWQLSPQDIVLSSVEGVPYKIQAARQFATTQDTVDRIIQVSLCRKQADDWNSDPQRATRSPEILGASTLGELLQQLQADEKHERTLESLCKANRIEVQRLRQPADTSTNHDRRRHEEHRLDCYVWPRYSTEVRQAESRDIKDSASVERVPVPGEGSEALDHLLRQLLSDSRNLATHDDAGAGKTIFSYQCLDALSRPLDHPQCLFDRRWPLVFRWHGRWPSTGEGANRRSKQLRTALAEDMVTQIREYAKEDCSLNDAAAAVDYALQQRRVVIIIDGFDQCDEADRTHLAGLLNPEHSPDKIAADDAQDAAHCRWIFTGRSYAIQKNSPRLFDHRWWTFARIERFDQSQWEQYFAMSGDGTTRLADRWREMVPDPDAVADLLGLPLVLREIRGIIEDSNSNDTEVPLPVFWTEGELHNHASLTLLKRAIKQRGLEVDGLRLHRLYELISVLAFQLMLESADYNGAIAGTPQNPHAVQEFRERAFNRWKAARQRSSDEIAEYRDNVELLTTIELSHRAVMDAFNLECLSFRNTKTMEWYAARYLTHHASWDDVFAAGQPSAVDFINVAEWSNCWKLAIDMPRNSVNPQVMARSLSALFHEPKAGTRPTELMFLAWPQFEYDRLLVRQLPFVVRDAQGKEIRKPGQTLVRDGLITESQLEDLGRQRVLPEAAGYVAEFRRTSQDLAAELDRCSRPNPPKRVYCRPQAGWRGTAKWLLKLNWLWGTPWQTATSRVKSHTLLQCPPQSLIQQLGDDALVGWIGSSPEESTWDSEQPRHRVRVRPFQLQATTVTREMYGQFDRNFQSAHSMERASAPQQATGDAAGHHNYPIIQTCWFDACIFCKWLGADYRLPTECEWEYACRAGTATPYHFGSGLNGQQANCNGNYPFGTDENGQKLEAGPYLKRTTVVGCADYPGNAFGLFDTHGNVWEWCWDYFENEWYSRRVSGHVDGQTNTETVHACDAGPAAGSSRVLRGGSWSVFAQYCVCASRHYDAPDYRSYLTGFRVCRG